MTINEGYMKKIINSDNTKSLARFVEQAHEIWGNHYDYTNSAYDGGKKPIIIYCPKHDYHFRVAMAQNHILKPHGTFTPTGCPICRAEITHKTEYGKDWSKYLKVSKKNCRVGLIRPIPTKKKKTPEQIAKEKAIKEAKQREKETYLLQWHSKNIKEAQFKERVYNMYGEQLDTSLVDYQSNDKDVTLICRNHGIFEIKPRILLVGVSKRNHKQPPHGCWKCCGIPDPKDNPKLTAKEFYQRIDVIYRCKNLTFERKPNVSMKTKITAVCINHGQIIHDAKWWLDGKGCDYCNGKFWPADWIKNAQAVHGNKYQYVGALPRTTADYIHYICKEHGLQEQRYDVHVSQGCGCSKCANYPNKKTPLQRCNEWIAQCEAKYGKGRYDYSRTHEDYVNNDSLIWIRCCIHDHWFQTTPDNNLRTANGSCPLCAAEFKESKGEAEIRRWLQKHGILEFTQEQYIPNNDPTLQLQYLSTDFWLPNYKGRNLIIEFHGVQHYEDIDFYYKDRIRNFAVQKHRDRYLRKYCKDNDIRLLEIPYWDLERIDEILTKELLSKEV